MVVDLVVELVVEMMGATGVEVAIVKGKIFPNTVGHMAPVRTVPESVPTKRLDTKNGPLFPTSWGVAHVSVNDLPMGKACLI